MAKAYEGDKPYIFISYSHKDTPNVMCVIEALQDAGFRVWYDGGIEAGSEWPEYIASHLRKCACMLAFISPAFVESKNCRRELNFAQDLNKDLLNVYIEEVELSDGMRMQLGLNQAMWRKNYPTFEGFLEALCDAKLLRDCREIPEEIPYNHYNSYKQPEPKAPAYQPPEPEAPVQEEAADEEEEPVILSGRGKALAWISSILEALYVPISVWLLNQLSSNNANGWVTFFVTMIPHIVIMWLNLRLFRSIGAPLDTKELAEASTPTACFWLLAVIASAIIGAFYIEGHLNFFVKLLISIGVNVVPTLVTLIMIPSLEEKPQK